ncbi:transposase [Streptomyces sp. NPDC002537]
MSTLESMAKKKPRPRRSFTPEFKAEIVELCRRGDRSVGQVAKDFDLTETAVRFWVSQAGTDAGERDGLTSSERAELATAEPKKLCYRLLHVDARLTRGARRPHLRITATWPWRHDLATAFVRLQTLPRPAT